MSENGIRGKIRMFARQENRIGALCSILLRLCHGDFEAAKETYQLHFIRDRARMTISARVWTWEGKVKWVISPMNSRSGRRS